MDRRIAMHGLLPNGAPWVAVRCARQLQPTWWRALANVLAYGVGTLSLAACSGSASTTGTQVVATVNGSDITAAQLETTRPFTFLLDPGADTQPMQPLDALIDEELLVQEAHKAKLDNDAKVQQEIERATRKILGEAYMEREITPKVTVSNDEIRAFYDRYPALFKHRRLFEFAEFVVADDALTPQLRADISQVRSADELRNRLNRRGVKFTQSKQAYAAEQLPMSRMNELAKITVGDVLIMARDDEYTRLLAITAIEEDPQSFAQAQPRIEQYLVTTRAQRLLVDYLKLVRATAAISVPHKSAASGDMQPPAADAGGTAFQLGAVTQSGVHATP